MTLDQLVKELNFVRVFHTTPIGRGGALGLVGPVDAQPLGEGNFDIPDAAAKATLVAYRASQVRLKASQVEWDAGESDRERQRQEAVRQLKEEQAEIELYGGVFKTLREEGYTPAEIRQAVLDLTEDGGKRA